MKQTPAGRGREAFLAMRLLACASSARIMKTKIMKGIMLPIGDE